jgi:hypothetical protein
LHFEQLDRAARSGHCKALAIRPHRELQDRGSELNRLAANLKVNK